MTADNGWHARLIRDRQGRADRIVAVRIGPTFTDAVAIEAESRCVALRLRTDDDSPLILPGEDSARGRCGSTTAPAPRCWRSCSS